MTSTISRNPPSRRVLEALAITRMAIGCEISPERAAVIASELAGYPEPAVLQALQRCKLECKFRLSLADVIDRIEDGHPGPEEAWTMVPKTEADSAVVTEEILRAIPLDLLAAGELVAARMAFRETYCRLVLEARMARRQPRWVASLGLDPERREAALRRAEELGHIGAAQTDKLLPHVDRGPVDPVIQRLTGEVAKAFRPDFAALKAGVAGKCRIPACKRPAGRGGVLCNLHRTAKSTAPDPFGRGSTPPQRLLPSPAQKP